MGYAQVMLAVSYIMSRTVYVLSDGEILVQLQSAVQKSGAYVTSSDNSRVRVWNAMFVGSRWAMAMGDDSVEQTSLSDGQLVQRYAVLGKRIKDVKRYAGRQIVFCSHSWHQGRCYPVDCSKMLFRLLQNDDLTPMLCRQFWDEVRNHPDFFLLQRLIESVGGYGQNAAEKEEGC